MDSYIGEVSIFGFDFIPQGWKLCDGSLLAISEYTSLFAVIRTTFGGDGQSTFGLPNLTRRVPVGAGQGPGLSMREAGTIGGVNSVTLDQYTMPEHRHGLYATPAGRGVSARSGSPINNGFGEGGGEAYGTGLDDYEMDISALREMGQGQPHENRQPFLVLNIGICFEGIFPPRQ